jgi:hypothetical protein
MTPTIVDGSMHMIGTDWKYRILSSSSFGPGPCCLDTPAPLMSSHTAVLSAVMMSASDTAGGTGRGIPFQATHSLLHRTVQKDITTISYLRTATLHVILYSFVPVAWYVLCVFNAPPEINPPSFGTGTNFVQMVSVHKKTLSVVQSVL